MAANYSWPTKTPTEHLDYIIDWSRRLPNGDTVANSAFIVPANTVTITANSFSNTTSTVWLQGGANNTNVAVTNIVHTAAGRVLEIFVTIQIRTP